MNKFKFMGLNWFSVELTRNVARFGFGRISVFAFNCGLELLGSGRSKNKSGRNVDFS